MLPPGFIRAPLQRSVRVSVSRGGAGGCRGLLPVLGGAAVCARARAFGSISALTCVAAQAASCLQTVGQGLGRRDGLSRGGCWQERPKPLISDDLVTGGVMGTLREPGAFLFGVPVPSMATVACSWWLNCGRPFTSSAGGRGPCVAGRVCVGV